MSLKFRPVFKKSLELFRHFNSVNISLQRFVRYATQKGGNPQMKVTVVGAAGRVGQPLCLMLKQSPLIDELVLHDISGTCGFGLELGYIDTKPKVTAYSAPESLGEALQGSKVVVLVAATPGSSYRAFQDMFEMNASIVKEFADAFAVNCPSALLAAATEPINCNVPLISEVLKKHSCYNPEKIFGVTTLNVVRSNAFVGHLLGLEPECVSVPVLGGSGDKTIVPVLSLATPCADFSLAELQLLTANIQRARQEIIAIKKIEESTLAAAFAISRFVVSLIKGLVGKTDVVECAFVRSVAHPHAKYLATPIQLGPGGVQRNKGLPELTEYEKCLLEVAISDINKCVLKAEKYIGAINEETIKCDPCSSDKKAPPCPPDACRKKTIYD